jgi:hypothetical protein
MLKIAYGLKLKSDTDKFIALTERAVEPINQAVAPDAYLVVRAALLLFVFSAKSSLTRYL